MSAQRRSSRKRATNTRISDLPDSSPTARSQPAPKRRKATSSIPHSSSAPRPTYENRIPVTPAASSGPRNRHSAHRPQVDANDTEEDIEEDAEEEDEPTLEDQNQDLTDLATRYLDVAPEPVAAAEAFKPEMWNEQNVQAFAKISGRKWTYFVREVKIVIGRNLEDARGGTASHEGNGSYAAPTDADKVHIDLGPNKMISRMHAELYFDSDTECWNISVHGRNGVRVNERQVRRNEVHRVESGDVLAIAGTQMLFQLAGVKMRIPDFFMDKIQQSAQGGASSYDDTNTSSAKRPEPASSSNFFLPSSAASSNAATAASRPSNGSRSILPIPYTIPPTRPKTPDTIAKMPLTSSIKRKSPTSNKRGMLIESTEQIDYSLDSAKDIKPGCSYAAMITWAILSTADEAISLNGIYQWIKDHYAFYRLSNSGWQNSIRHNLSLNQNFRKVPRAPNEPGKGMKWAFVPENREATIIAANKNASKGGGRLSSAPGSPANAPSRAGLTVPTHPTPDSAMNHGPVPSSAAGSAKLDSTASEPPPSSSAAIMSQSNHNDVPYKPGLAQRTPPLSSHQPQFSSAQTPSYHAHRPITSMYIPPEARLPVLSDETSPMPRRINGHMTIHGSSPTLTSGAYNSTDLPMHTPAPRAYNLHVPQPNTIKLPTSHMTDSSPAPFWKPLGLGIGTTPARWPDSSPQKMPDTILGPRGGHITAGDSAIDHATGGGTGVPALSSSPPSMPNGPESPTRLPTSSANRNHTQSNSMANLSSTVGGPTLSPIKESHSPKTLPSLPIHSLKSRDEDDASTSSLPASTAAGFNEARVDEERGIDLMKGFTKISTFHQPPRQSAAQPAQMRYRRV